ncbi:hypothetical protein LNQ52_24590 [Klebsiella pneumoniae subsp. pneumoniae]|nr:hypothetical protein [Klebsiella pneumoniae subsp. pneumoniae]
MRVVTKSAARSQRLRRRQLTEEWAPYGSPSRRGSTRILRQRRQRQRE